MVHSAGALLYVTSSVSGSRAVYVMEHSSFESPLG